MCLSELILSLSIISHTLSNQIMFPLKLYHIILVGGCRTELARYIFDPKDIPAALTPILGVALPPLGKHLVA